MNVHLIVAASANGIIGRDGDLPWRLPADLARFKKITTGHCIIMGRKTYASIGRALPGRTSIVISRNPDLVAAGCDVVHSFEEALSRASALGEGDAFVIGGEAIYTLALPLAHTVHITRVDAVIPGDAHFPPLDPSTWRCVSSERHEADARNEYAVLFTTFERI